MRSERRTRKNYRMFRITAAFVLAAAMIMQFADIVGAAETQAVPEAVPGAVPEAVPATVPGTVPTTVPVAIVAPDPVNEFLSQSAFIGNSVGEGLTMYNNAHGKVPLGNATMLTRVSYSFYADKNSMSKYIPKYAGTPMRAKDAIKQSGALYVFISMGTNDLVGSASAENAFANYQEYLNGILTENPLVMIFIESCTPTRPGSNVDNVKVTTFNAYMKSYCDKFPNMNYVDIATPLMDETGYLAAGLSSDGSVHLTNKAYEIWSNTIRTYITNFLVIRSAALKLQQER
ncbi:MAG: hypothetical protein K6E63_01165 [Lachnospiraceae bacterium]|nr:hypothetical protein [Lachnospiraceae bacterium]